MKSKKFNAGVIGLGVGKRHLDLYLHNPNILNVKVCDLNIHKLEKIKKEYKNVLICDSADCIIEDPQIDIVSIASYDNSHHEHIIKALSNKKHIIVEKPICISEIELISICEKAKNNPELIIASNFVLRSNPYFKYFKKLIENNEIGEIYHIEGDYNYGRLNKITNGWRGDIENYSVSHGGGIHIIDLIMWLTGERIEKCASLGNKFSTRNSKFKGNNNLCEYRFDNINIKI